MQAKTCTKCNKDKSIDDFSKCKNSKDGYLSYCKQCRSELRRVKYDPRICVVCGKEFIPKMVDSIICSTKCSHDKCYIEHKEERLAHHREYCKKVYPRDKEKNLNRAIKYAQEHKEERKQYLHVYYRENKEILSKKQKKYNERNREQRNLYERDRKRNNIQLRIIHNLRSRINKVITKGRKSKHTIELLGCSIDEFKDHIESLFVSDMNWNNYGKWHIDHIIPCSVFDLENSEEQDICFHHTNLQPLWANDNISKSNRIFI